MPLAQQLVRDVERRHHRDAIGAAHLAAVADLAHALVEQCDRLREFLALAFLARDLEVAAENRDVERDAVAWVGRCCHSPLLTLGHPATTTAEVSASLAPHGAAPFGPRLGCASPAVLTLGLLARSRQQTTAEVSASLSSHGGAAPFGPRLGCASPAVLTLGLLARSRQQRPPKCRP